MSLIVALGAFIVLFTLGSVFGAALILGELTVRVLGLNESDTKEAYWEVRTL